MEELRKKLMEELKNKLGEGYEVSPVDVNKNNGTILHGISILLKGNIGGPMGYVDNFYVPQIGYIFMDHIIFFSLKIPKDNFVELIGEHISSIYI